ncbi:MAG: hypothetical protein EAZ64_01490 [Sphingobacteriales bacterium]|nr:MAG: hypothetical protein EAZ64_01490 [Sphingobacteriales bacterium]
MKLTFKKYLLFVLGFLAIVVYSSCSSQNPGYIGRKIQNLTAHYNIYFNAKEGLKESEEKIKTTYKENYAELLDIYPIPTEQTAQEQTAPLNEVIKRANTIALKKSASTWVDDAYLLLARSEYYKGNFFNASEYFSYVSLTYPKETKNRLEALIGDAKTNLAMDRLPEADSLLNEAKNIKSKHHQSNLNALLAQAAVNHNDYNAAVNYLKTAIKLCKNKFDKIRWTFILAQLEENIGAKTDAYTHYTRVVKSNASYELSFMANLYRIKVKEEEKGIAFDKIATLKKLIKDDKNVEFIDQIHYQIGNAYLEKGKRNLAITSYKKSTATTPGSEQQKGLSFLKLAEINFDTLKNYVQSQIYYDSTLQFLPKESMGYAQIEKKAKNLQYLADRLQIISREDEMLALAALPDSIRNKKISAIIISQLKEVRKKDSLSANELMPLNPLNNTNTTKSTGAFYFNNSSAISQGILEFNKRWGKRKLSDNWRISAVAENASQNALTMLDPDQATPTLAKVSSNPDSLKANYLRDVPLTQEAKDKANLKVLTAFYEISNFYKDVLNDNQAAIQSFEELLKRYPESDYTAGIYYQLFRLYSETDKTKAEDYKNLLLQKYPKTDFARTITDPDFGKAKELQAAALNTYYENVFELYNNNNFNEVMVKISEAKVTFAADSSNMLPPQFMYINVLALGHLQSINPFLSELENITKTYPSDTTLVPRVLKQIAYIKQNKAIFDARKFALEPLPTEDSNLPEQKRYTSPREVKYIFEDDYDAEPLVTKKNKKETKPQTNAPKVPEKIIPTNFKDSVINAAIVKQNKVVPNNGVKNYEAITPPAPIAPSEIKFEDGIRQKQAIVINVLDRSLNIAKSFAGISKYFYSKFNSETLVMVIKELEKGNKLIIIKGDFYGTDRTKIILDEFKLNAAEYITMPAYKYNTFIISEINLGLINSQNALDQYLKYLKLAKKDANK